MIIVILIFQKKINKTKLLHTNYTFSSRNKKDWLSTKQTIKIHSNSCLTQKDRGRVQNVTGQEYFATALMEYAFGLLTHD